LLDTIPAFLDELIEAERSSNGILETTQLPAASQHARNHGKQRFHRGYAISELPLDFAAISDAIGELASEHDLRLDARSYKLLSECMDTAISHSIDEYFTLSRAEEEGRIATWVGSLGHELRNAVSSALMAYTAIEAGHVPVQSRTGHILGRSLRRIEALVSRTLAAMQLKSGAPLQRDTVNVRDLALDVIETIVRDHDVAIRVDIDPALVLLADTRLLESALSNLVQNAVKFTHDHGTVRVRGSYADDGIVLEVEDECGGLGGVDTEALFGAFVQGDKRKSGVGLGLAITRQAIEAHGGHVGVRDLPAKGCVFSAWLPR
jgi:hypothetical protein